MEYMIALSDSLYKQFHAFKHAEDCDQDIIQKMLYLYKPPHITNVAQLKRAGIEDNPLLSLLAQSELVNQSVEELAARTVYKVLLDEERKDFPYVNINEDSVQNNYSLTFLPKQDRGKAQEYVQALLRDANQILISDRYFKDNWRITRKFFSELVPRNRLSIFYAYDHLKGVVSDIKRICSHWTVKQDRLNTYRNHHDRYVRIDGTIEIIFTSGIDYLFDDSKECTLVIRKVR